MVTSRDVARLAGVSQPTVSRALRGDRTISASTRERVERAASSLNYVTNRVARNLVLRRSGRIGIVASELTNPFYPALLAPIHEALDAAGYTSLMLTSSEKKDPDVTPLVDGSADGIILAASRANSQVPALLQKMNIPFVLANRMVDGVECDRVSPDNLTGARAVADLLVSQEHRRVGIIGGPADISTSNERMAAFTQRLADLGVPVPSRYIRAGQFSNESGASAFSSLMQMEQPPTAIFCANDVIAIGALNAAAGLGISIPSEVTLVGFDDIPQSGWQRIRLTTVRVDLSRLASAAVSLLLERIEDPTLPPRTVLLPADLILRDSHSGPADRH